MNIINIMLWMQRNAYEESTIKKVAKLLRHLKKNCNPKTQKTDDNHRPQLKSKNTSLSEEHHPKGHPPHK
jgi:hypothetical protein